MANTAGAINFSPEETCFPLAHALQVIVFLAILHTYLINGRISYVFMIVFVAGYKGWGCTDESEAVSEIDLLAATLLLCLSNLLYLPAVGLAIYRGFYTESFVYFANMIASTVCILHTTIHLFTFTSCSSADCLQFSAIPCL